MERRAALGMIASATAAASPALRREDGVAAKHAATAFDPSDPAHVALAIRKLAFSADDRVTWWWMIGTRYGVVGGVMTPLWDSYIGTWCTTRDLADGHYEVRLVGVLVNTPPGRTTLLERFENPYTGRVVEHPYPRPRALTTLMTPTEGSPYVGPAPGMKRTVSYRHGPAWVEGRDVIVRTDMSMHAEPLDPARRAFMVNDLSTFVGNVDEILDPGKPSPAATQAFNDIADFPAWLQMGDQPGLFFARCWGRKVGGYGQMPATWRRHLEARFPEVARDPAELLKS